MDLARRRVERDEDVLARLVAGRVDPGDQRLERGLVRLEVGREAALVADRGGEAPVVSVRFSAWKTSVPTRRPREAAAPGYDHELLEVDRVVGVGAAVQHVHHRHRQQGASAVPRARRRSGRAARRRRPPTLAAASETPRIALAPRRDLFGVPSSSIIARSSAAWSPASAAT